MVARRPPSAATIRAARERRSSPRRWTRSRISSGGAMPCATRRGSGSRRSRPASRTTSLEPGWSRTWRACPRTGAGRRPRAPPRRLGDRMSQRSSERPDLDPARERAGAPRLRAGGLHGRSREAASRLRGHGRCAGDAADGACSRGCPRFLTQRRRFGGGARFRCATTSSSAMPMLSPPRVPSHQRTARAAAHSPDRCPWRALRTAIRAASRSTRTNLRR